MIGLDRLKRAISDVPTGGMQTGSPKVKLDLSFAHRVAAEMEQLEREKAELVAQVGKLMQIATNEALDHKQLIKQMREFYGVLYGSPTKHLNQIKAEAGKTGFVEGSNQTHNYLTGDIGELPMLKERADQYAASIAKGE